MQKLLIITGPTATGKTKLGIELAKKFGGETISADSRQVYRGNDEESGKDKNIYGEIKYWGIDLVKKGQKYNVADFVKYAQEKVTDIQRRGKLPIIVGGTGQYIKELLTPSETLNIPLDPKLRASLEKYSLEDLQKHLKRINPKKWGSLNQSDRLNPRRLVRAVEVATQSQKSKVKSQNYKSEVKNLNMLIIGLAAPRRNLYDLISKRRANRPDLVEKEFILAKKQLLYQKKFLPAVWLDISEPGYHDRIIAIVEKWYTTVDGPKET